MDDWGDLMAQGGLVVALNRISHAGATGMTDAFFTTTPKGMAIVVEVEGDQSSVDSASRAEAAFQAALNASPANIAILEDPNGFSEPTPREL
jgi:fumarate reductase subunit C